jgi:hypothetical protein
MGAAHGHRHASDAAGDGSTAQQAAMMQSLYARPFAQAEFTQALAVRGGQGIPVDQIHISGLAQRQISQAQG